MTDDDDLFGWAMFRAIIAAYRMERPKMMGEEIPQAEPDQTTERRPLPKLPAGVQWVNSTRVAPGELPKSVRVCVWLTRRDKVYLPTVPATEEGIERAARAAVAGRKARDAGEGREAVLAAMRGAS